MRLTFENRKFCLQRDDGKMLFTRDIKKAARFRNAADSKAEKIFKTRMLIDVPLPSGVPFTPHGLELFDFQKNRGIPYILSKNKTYLAHSPGLGKTAQAICAVSMKPGRTLVICPSFLKINWAREITKWFARDFVSIQIVNRPAPIVGDFVIISDAILGRPEIIEMLLKENFRFVFVDEAHRFKTHTTNRTIALFGGRNKKVKSQGIIILRTEY